MVSLLLVLTCKPSNEALILSIAMLQVARFRRPVACFGGLGLLMFGVSACGGDGGPVRLGGATAVATNWGTSCAVRRDGKVLCWGGNSDLALDVDGIAGATAVSVGNAFACGLLADGTVRCWGDSFGGELGNGTNTIVVSAPVSVSGISSAAALSVGYSHACALLDDGTIQCWGANDAGQLGIGTNVESDVPSTVLGISGAKGVSAGQYGTCAVLMDGTVRCWGVNSYGQLGDGTTTDSSVPVAVSGLTGAVAVCTGSDHSCASLEDGTVRCWGSNAFGENGNDAVTGSPIPVVVTGITNAVAVTCGTVETCAVLSDGSIQCWGGNGGSSTDSFGALGNPTAATLDCKYNPNPPDGTVSYETTCAPTPVQVSGITNATTVAAGYYSVCAALADGSVECWGDNQFGQLGDGSTSNRTSPVPVMAQSGQ